MKQVKRTKDENARYIDLMESAIDKAEQAIGSITYSSFPEINAELRKKIQNACCILEEALELESEVCKPTRK